MEESESKEEEKDGVITSINRLSEHMQGILSTARKYVSDSVEDFVSQKVGCLFPLMTHYAETFQRHDITTRKEFDKIIKKYFKHEEVQEVYEELLQTEDEWDSFLSDIDKVLIKQTSVDEVKLGGPGPNDIPLIDVGTGHQVSLSSFVNLAGHVVVILLRHFA